MSQTVKTVARALLVALVAVGSFAGGMWWDRRSGSTTSHEQQEVHYACPMHPQYVSDRPGDCPACGMRLEPVRTDGAGKSVPGSGGGRVPARSVQVNSDRQLGPGRIAENRAPGNPVGRRDRHRLRRVLRFSRLSGCPVPGSRFAVFEQHVPKPATRRNKVRLGMQLRVAQPRDRSGLGRQVERRARGERS